MSHRREKVAAEIRKNLQEVISRGLNDPRITGLITVTEVNVSPDLKNADVGVSVLPDDRETLVLHGLRHSASHIRRKVADLVGFHQMPQLSFRIDNRFKKQAEVLDAIARISAEREASSDGSASTENDPPAGDTAQSHDTDTPPVPSPRRQEPDA